MRYSVMISQSIKQTTLFLGLILFGFSPTSFAVNLDETPKNFTRTGHDGKPYTLYDYKDKTVILEWYNDDCPFVKRHYGNNNMQKLQEFAKKEGMVWFSVISSAKGLQGHIDGPKAKKIIASRKSTPKAILFDEEGTLGRQFGAKKTPHMYIIHKGKLIFAGGIDGEHSADPDTVVAPAKDYFRNALKLVADDKVDQIKIRDPEAYGCSVKYKS